MNELYAVQCDACELQVVIGIVNWGGTPPAHNIMPSFCCPWCGDIQPLVTNETIPDRDWEAEAALLLDDNKKVAAIKVIREICKSSLRDAKAMCESLDACDRLVERNKL